VKIGIIGGTGDIGEGMAMRFSQYHEVIIGSRDKEKAEECCRACEALLHPKEIPCTLTGCFNQDAIDASEIVILAIPFRFLVATLQELQGMEGKLVVSPVNPIQKSTFFYYSPPPEGSAALLVKKLLPPSARVCAAFNNIAANCWRDLDKPLEYSVAVCGDDDQAKQTVMKLVKSIPHLAPVDAGPLGAASMVESLTPLLLNLGKFSQMKDAGVRFQ
jgi:NADPH-dependent F420 reductase